MCEPVQLQYVQKKKKEKIWSHVICNVDTVKKKSDLRKEIRFALLSEIFEGAVVSREAPAYCRNDEMKF